MPRLRDFRVLTFDCYGTLIDWETGLLRALEPWLATHGRPVEPDRILEAYARHEAAEEAADPGARYPEILARVHRRLAADWEITPDERETRRFAASIRDWPPFPDSPPALAYLAEHARLAILSNVDRESIEWSRRQLGARFEWIFTAEEIGSYKPDPRNFEHMLRALAEEGIDRTEILHTAQSLFHDHLPASRLGLATNWIDRRHDRPGWGATEPPPEMPRLDFRHRSMAEFAERHRLEGGADGR